MDFKDFDSYNSTCVVCKESLILEAELLCFINTDKRRYNAGVCGINYFFFDDKFYKGDFFSTKHNKTLAAKIYKVAIDSFVVNKRIYPHFGKSKMQPYMKRSSYIAAMELTYKKSCIKQDSNHEYIYNSGILFNGNTVSNDELYIDYETIYVDGFNIENSFFDNIIANTNVVDIKNKKQTVLPAIKVSNWDFSNTNNLKEQIEKYSLLI